MNSKNFPPPPPKNDNNKRLNLREYLTNKPIAHRTRANNTNGTISRQYDQLNVSYPSSRMKSHTVNSNEHGKQALHLQQQQIILEERERSIQEREREIIEREQFIEERERYIEECENKLIDEAQHLSERYAMIEQHEENQQAKQSA